MYAKSNATPNVKFIVSVLYVSPVTYSDAEQTVDFYYDCFADNLFESVVGYLEDTDPDTADEYVYMDDYEALEALEQVQAIEYEYIEFDDVYDLIEFAQDQDRFYYDDDGNMTKCVIERIVVYPSSLSIEEKEALTLVTDAAVFESVWLY